MDAAKPQPYTFDLGHLLCTDSNPLPTLPSPTDALAREAILSSTARDCAQALINQLLTTCPITRAADDGSLQINLPAPETALPREKPVPKEKEKTKWERFAAKKGIRGKRREGKLVFDEGKGDWVPKYGYKGKKTEDGDWLVEVDEKAGGDKAKGRGGKAAGPKERSGGEGEGVMGATRVRKARKAGKGR